MNNKLKIAGVLILIIIIIGFLFIFRSIDESLIDRLSKLFNIAIKSYWVDRLQKFGSLLLISGFLFLSIGYLLHNNWLFVKKIINGVQRISGWIKTELRKFIQFESDKADVEKEFRIKINGCDLAIAAAFLLVALLFFYNPCQGGSHFVELGGDAATYTSVAAAYDHPELFKGDPVYGDVNLYKIYLTIQTPLIRLINHFTNNYSLSFIILIIPHIFFQLLGFYLLGRLLFKNRFWALFLAVITFIPISLDQELWGVWLPLPRILFQTILPYLWCLAFIWKDKPNKWPWLMIFSGILFYLHSISGLTWGFCIWLGFWFFLPKKWTNLQKLFTLLGLGFLYLIVIIPFAIFIIPGQHIGASVDYEFIFHILKTFLPANIVEVPDILMGFIKITMLNGVLPIACLSIIVLSILKKFKNSDIYLSLIWIVGILTSSIAIPFFVRIVEKIFRIIPMEIILTRGLRYIYPLLLLLFVWAMAEVFQRAEKKIVLSIVIVIGMMFLLFYGISQREYFAYSWQKIEYLFLGGKPVCLTNETKGQAIEAISNLTPPGSRIFTYTWRGIETTEFYEIRYAALRPLVFNFKDSMYFTFRNYDKLQEWYGVYWSLVKIVEGFPKPCERLIKLIDLQKKLQADYLFVDSNGNDLTTCNSEAKLLLNIKNYYLYK
jgi:hypothetical protein